MIVDLSADVGEGADDLPLFPFLTSVSVACGAHAGDEATMERCVAEAKRLGVSVGAHPGFPDREGFGRRVIPMSDDDLARTLRRQIGVLRTICERGGVPLTQVKPHGALYNEAAVDHGLAVAVVEAVRTEGLIVVALAGSKLLAAAGEAGIDAAAEAFADRRYLADGTLAPRSLAGSLIEDPAAAAEQAVALATGGPIRTIDGDPLVIEGVRTVCLHSDTPGAPDTAGTVRDALERADVRVAPLAGR